MEISKFQQMGGANKLKWTEKIENSLIDPPPTIGEGRVLLGYNSRDEILIFTFIHKVFDHPAPPKRTYAFWISLSTRIEGKDDYTHITICESANRDRDLTILGKYVS